MSNNNNKEKHDETFLDNKDNNSANLSEELNEPALSPDDNNSKENDGSDDNVNESLPNKDTSSVKSGEAAQQTPNNLSETTSPKASCSYQDFGKF